MPKVALCLPNFRWGQLDKSAQWQFAPHTICLLAAVIRDRCDVDIIDGNMEDLSEDEFRRRIGENGYDMVGVSVLFDSLADAGALAVSLAKEALPNVVTVIGGVYPTMNPADALDIPGIDYVCIGEGEASLRGLVGHLFHGEAMPEAGFAFRRDGLPVIQPRSPFVEDLDALPMPAYDLVDFGAYMATYHRKTVDGPVHLPYVELITSRGCPQNCCFCQGVKISGRRVRMKSARRVLDEIRFFRDRYGVRSLVFMDDNLVAVRARARDIFSGMIKEELDMPWKAAAIAVFRLDEELLDLMAKSGCRYIDVAIESGVPRVLSEIIDKPVDLEHAKRMTRYAQSRGIYVAANFVVGFPGETWEEIRRTIRYIEELSPDYAKIFSAVPLRHTRLWDICEEDGWFAPGFDPAHVSWNKGQIRSPHFDDRELTILRAYEWDRINFATPEKTLATADMMGITVEELNQIRIGTRKDALDKLARS